MIKLNKSRGRTASTQCLHIHIAVIGLEAGDKSRLFRPCRVNTLSNLSHDSFQTFTSNDEDLL